MPYTWNNHPEMGAWREANAEAAAEDKARADAVIAVLWDEAAFLDWADQAGPEMDAAEAAEVAYYRGYRDGYDAALYG